MKASYALLWMLILLIRSTGHGQTVRELYDSGLAKLIREDYKGAISDLNKAIGLNGEYAEAYCARGRARFTEDNQGGMDDLTKAIAINPGYAEVYCFKGFSKVL